MVQQNEAERDAQIDADPDYDTRSDAGDWATERRDIEAVFATLAE